MTVNFTETADAAEKIYRLAKEILADFRSTAFRKKRTRFKKYRELFDVVRRSHIQYIDIFSNIKQDVIFKDLETAKHIFREKRKFHFTERSLAKFDAHTYLQICPDKDEKRFLGAVLWYFHYRDTHGHVWHGDLMADIEIETAIKLGGDAAWDSASSAALFQIEEAKTDDEVIEISEKTLKYINDRYVNVARYFTYIEASHL